MCAYELSVGCYIQPTVIRAYLFVVNKNQKRERRYARQQFWPPPPPLGGSVSDRNLNTRVIRLKNYVGRFTFNKLSFRKCVVGPVLKDPIDG